MSALPLAVSITEYWSRSARRHSSFTGNADNTPGFALGFAYSSPYSPNFCRHFGAHSEDGHSSCPLENASRLALWRHKLVAYKRGLLIR